MDWQTSALKLLGMPKEATSNPSVSVNDPTSSEANLTLNFTDPLAGMSHRPVAGSISGGASSLPSSLPSSSCEGFSTNSLWCNTGLRNPLGCGLDTTCWVKGSAIRIESASTMGRSACRTPRTHRKPTTRSWSESGSRAPSHTRRVAWPRSRDEGGSASAACSSPVSAAAIDLLSSKCLVYCGS